VSQGWNKGGEQVLPEGCTSDAFVEVHNETILTSHIMLYRLRLSFASCVYKVRITMRGGVGLMAPPIETALEVRTTQRAQLFLLIRDESQS
jgi:hypothetical protein